jgi:hypothetical protein
LYANGFALLPIEAGAISKDEARRIAANIATLPGRKGSDCLGQLLAISLCTALLPYRLQL